MSEHESLVEQLARATPFGNGYVRISNKLQLRLLEVLRGEEQKPERRTTSRGKAVSKTKQ